MGLMLFAFPVDFGSASRRRRRISRALVSLQFLPAVMFPLPAIIAELFQDPFLLKQPAGTAIEASEDARNITLSRRLAGLRWLTPHLL